MGIGAAAIFPSTLSLIANIFIERRERAKAIGLWGATTGVGVAIGPIVGGWLLVHYWWGSVFLFMVPVAAVVALLVGFAVPTSRDPSTPPIDWRGVLLSTVGMGLIVLSIIQAPSGGGSRGAPSATAAAGLAIMAAFVWVESRTARPMLDVTLFQNLRFTAASGSIIIAFFTLAGFTFLVTQYFQFVRGYTAFGTGLTDPAGRDLDRRRGHRRHSARCPDREQGGGGHRAVRVRTGVVLDLGRRHGLDQLRGARQRR